jgi:Rieske Fe-S protein
MSANDRLSGDCSERCGRRTFLLRSAVGLSAILLPVAGCASVATTRVRPEGGVARVSPSELPSLQGADGHARLVVDDAGTVVDVLAADGRFIALSPICTHLGCTVAVQGARLVCPCHGSTYARDGRVLRGPAERSLRTFPVSVEADGTLVVRLDGAS